MSRTNKKEPYRNPYVVALLKRIKKGKMSDKRNRRESGKNKQAEILKEADYE